MRATAKTKALFGWNYLAGWTRTALTCPGPKPSGEGRRLPSPAGPSKQVVKALFGKDSNTQAEK